MCTKISAISDCNTCSQPLLLEKPGEVNGFCCQRCGLSVWLGFSNHQPMRELPTVITTTHMHISYKLTVEPWLYRAFTRTQVRRFYLTHLLSRRQKWLIVLNEKEVLLCVEMSIIKKSDEELISLYRILAVGFTIGLLLIFDLSQ